MSLASARSSTPRAVVNLGELIENVALEALRVRTQLSFLLSHEPLRRLDGFAQGPTLAHRFGCVFASLARFFLCAHTDRRNAVRNARDVEPNAGDLTRLPLEPARELLVHNRLF